MDNMTALVSAFATEPLFRCMRVWASWSTAEIPRAFVPAIPAGKRSCSCGWIWKGKRLASHVE